MRIGLPGEVEGNSHTETLRRRDPDSCLFARGVFVASLVSSAKAKGRKAGAKAASANKVESKWPKISEEMAQWCQELMTKIYALKPA